MFGRARIKKLEDRVDALERELVKFLTQQKTQAMEEKPHGPIISTASEEGEPWLKPGKTKNEHVGKHYNPIIFKGDKVW